MRRSTAAPIVTTLPPPTVEMPMPMARFAVVAKRSAWGINVIPADGRDVFQIDELAAAITPSPDEQILEIFDPVHSPVGLIVIASGPTSTAPLWTTRFCSRSAAKIVSGWIPSWAMRSRASSM